VKMGEESQCGKEKSMKLTKNAEVRQYDEKGRRRMCRKENGLLILCVCVCARVCVCGWVCVWAIYTHVEGSS
jgi:hypothetical protein